MQIVVGIGLTVAVAGCHHAGQRESLNEKLRNMVWRVQELMDAVAPRNNAPWQKYFADEYTYFDEKGRQMEKTMLVKGRRAVVVGIFGDDRGGNLAELDCGGHGDFES